MFTTARSSPAQIASQSAINFGFFASSDISFLLYFSPTTLCQPPSWLQAKIGQLTDKMGAKPDGTVWRDAFERAQTALDGCRRSRSDETATRVYAKNGCSAGVANRYNQPRVGKIHKCLKPPDDREITSSDGLGRFLIFRATGFRAEQSRGFESDVDRIA